MKYKLLLIILLSLFLPLSGRAAILYLEPASGSYHSGDTFVVSLRIDTEKECINTVEGNLSFSKDILEAIDFSQGNSLLTLWISPPLINQATGAISFSGGIPGGYCGRIPGDAGESNLLGKIIFKVQSGVASPTVGGRIPDAQVRFLETSQVLLNDGFGTPAKLSVAKEAVFTILSGIAETPKKEWQEELEKDKIPPEQFKIEINQDQAIFEGKYFITFSTTDKQTGIDYYEVKEGKGDWQKTISPYLLEDQSLESIIKVKAVDKAGNERIAEYPIPKKPLPYWIIILVLIGAGIIWLWKRYTKKHK